MKVSFQCWTFETSRVFKMCLFLHLSRYRILSLKFPSEFEDNCFIFFLLPVLHSFAGSGVCVWKILWTFHPRALEFQHCPAVAPLHPSCLAPRSLINQSPRTISVSALGSPCSAFLSPFALGKKILSSTSLYFVLSIFLFFCAVFDESSA